MLQEMLYVCHYYIKDTTKQHLDQLSALHGILLHLRWPNN
jgi:hypothetical protein